MSFIKVYVDGACPGNGTPSARGGWGVYVPSLGLERCGRLPSGPQTNNRAELYAIKKGIEIAADRSYNAQIHTDSDLCVKTFNEWAPRWERNGWTTRDGGAVENLDLVQDIYDDYQARRVEFIKVAGHSRNYDNDRAGNDRAHELATQGARS